MHTVGKARYVIDRDGNQRKAAQYVDARVALGGQRPAIISGFGGGHTRPLPQMRKFTNETRICPLRSLILKSRRPIYRVEGTPLRLADRRLND